MFDAICLLCCYPRSLHKNGATGKNNYLNSTFPRWRCPVDFKTGGEIVGDGQFARIINCKGEMK